MPSSTPTIAGPDKAAEPGAPVPAGHIPLSVPNISGEEWTYVRECLDTGWVSSVGSFVDRFERELAAAVGAELAIATVNGTAALHVALLLAGVEAGDEVIVPSLTFIAPANAVRYTGAFPTFVDVDDRYWQIDPDSVEAFLRDGCSREGGTLRNRATGRRVRAMVVVDILGHPADLGRLHALATEYGIQVVEDATESLGASYEGKPLGSITPLTAFSFNGNKLLTTGGGGMLVTNDETLAKRARYLTTQAKIDPIEFVHGDVGYNYRLTNIQAAVGVAQLERLDEFVAIKRRIAARYREAVAPLQGVSFMPEAPWAKSACWLATIRLARDAASGSRDLLRTLGGAGIQARPLWQPLHLSPAHKASYSMPCPVATQLQEECLSIPCSTHLTEVEQERVINTLVEALSS